MRIVIFAALLSVLSQANGGDEAMSFSATSYADNTSFKSTVSKAALIKAPTWAEGTARPPLSPKRAREEALRQLQQVARDVKEWDLREISLVDTGDHLHWIYVVRFIFHIPKDVEYIGGPQSFEIAVLMDGTAIKPEVVPISK